MYKINTADFGWSQIDDEFILYSIKNNSYYVLNETAKEIWELLYQSTNNCTFNDIINHIQSVFECDDLELVENDVSKLIEIYSEIGIIQQV